MPRRSGGTGTGHPLVNFKFIVEVGTSQAGFSEVLIPEVHVAVIDYREGNDTGNTARKFPGLASSGHVVLKRGMSVNQDLFEWWQLSERGAPERRNVTISLLNADRDVVKTWKILNAWPVRYAGAGLNALGNEIVIEALEMAHEGIILEA